ncbi:hypothetical protein GCM10027615_13450 [Plantactinospora veratri]
MISAVAYASLTAKAPSAAVTIRVRRKPVPRLTRLPIAMIALFPAALPAVSGGGEVLSRAGDAEISVAPSWGGGTPSGMAFALRYSPPAMSASQRGTAGRAPAGTLEP